MTSHYPADIEINAFKFNVEMGKLVKHQISPGI